MLRPTRTEAREIGSDLEPVDDPLLQVVGEPHRDDRGREHHGLHHDPGQQELPVVRAGDRDRPAEHEGEQQHEHHRLHGDVEQHLRHPLDVDQVAPDHGRRGLRQGRRGDRRAAARPAGGRRRGLRGRHWSTSAVSFWSWPSARCPVRCRNTSSRLGRLSPRSSTSIPLGDDAADPGHVAEAVGLRGQPAVPCSTWTSAEHIRTSPSAQEIAACVRVTTTLACPAWSLSCSAGGDHLLVDDDDLVGELVGLLEVLRGQQQRGALADQSAEHLLQLERLRVEPGGRLEEASTMAPRSG